MASHAEQEPAGSGERSSLGALLRRQARAIRDEVVGSGGQVSDEQLARLERLAQVAELYKLAAPPARKRWPVAAAVALTLALVSVLLFVRVPATEIELDLVLSEVGFVLSSPQVLSNGLNLSALGVSGLREIQLPADVNPALARRASDATQPGIRLSTRSSGIRPGTLNLAPIMVPGGTNVWVRHAGVAWRYQVSAKAPPGSTLALGADVNGSVRLGPAGAPAEDHDFASPRAVVLDAGSDEVDLDLAFAGKAEGVFSSNIAVRQLSLFRIEEFRDASHALVRRASTILSGTLYYDSLNGQEVKLRPGMAIEFEAAKGMIRRLELGEQGLTVKFHGTVRGMTTGPGETRRNLMPTSLEWLTARHGLSLLWGTVLYLSGLLLSALRWWRGTL